MACKKSTSPGSGDERKIKFSKIDIKHMGDCDMKKTRLHNYFMRRQKHLIDYTLFECVRCALWAVRLTVTEGEREVEKRIRAGSSPSVRMKFASRHPDDSSQLSAWRSIH